MKQLRQNFLHTLSFKVIALYQLLDDLPQYDEWPDNLFATVHQVNKED